MKNDQFEIWVQTGDRWHLNSWFTSLEVAAAVFANRTYRQRLIHAVYEDGKLVQQEVIAEVGRTRETA